MNVKSFLYPYRRGFVLPLKLGIPLYRKTRFDSYYSKTAVVVRGNNIFTTKPTKKLSFSFTVPQNHEILHIAVHDTDTTTAVFHTDKKKLYVTMSNGETRTTLDLGAPKEVRVFDSAMVIKQKNNKWLVVPVLLPNYSNGWLHLHNGNDFKSRLRDKTLVLPEEQSPIFMRLKRPRQPVMGDTLAGMFITSDLKLHFIDGIAADSSLTIPLDVIFDEHDPEKLQRKFENIKHIRTTFEGIWAFQFDDGPIYTYGYDYESERYKLYKLDRIGQLVETENIPAAQKNTKLSILGSRGSVQAVGLPSTRRIIDLMWADEKALTPNDLIMVDEQGEFHAITMMSKQPAPSVIESFGNKLFDLFKHQYAGFQETTLFLLKNFESILPFLKLC